MIDPSDFLDSLTTSMSSMYVYSKAKEFIDEKFNHNSDQLSHKFSKIFKIQGWDLDSTMETIEIIKATESVEYDHIDKSLDWIIAYEIPPSNIKEDISLKHILSSKKPSEWQHSLHEVGVTSAFSSPKELTLDEIIQAIVKMNPDSEAILEYANGSLKKDVLKVKEIKKSDLLPDEQKISKWDEKVVRKWAQKVKESNWLTKPKRILEAVAVISQGNYLLNKYGPRFTQIITVLITLKTGDCGLLMQVSTGEGKSLIVSILATIKCLQGHTIDIVTSSNVLAKRDAVSMKEFYYLFALTCDHNDEFANKKKCYS